MSRIDVHHHIYPPVFTKALERHGGDPSGWYVPNWTVELDNDMTAAIGVKTSILSVTAPGAVIEGDSAKAAALARQCNEFTASIRDAHPTTFGFFASLPSLFDTEACLKEIRYSFDVLKADGITLFTRYGKGHDYLGAQAFQPIWSELSRRKAVVFIHPTHPVDTALVNSALPQPMFDYPHETGRTAMDLLLTGTLRDNPACKIILSHAGGTLPYLIYRAAVMLPHTPVSVGRSTAELIEEAREAFYYDTAISASEVTLKALFAFAKPGRVLFGSDFPNAPCEGIVRFTEMLEDYSKKIGEEAWKDLQYRSALELFPRLEEKVV